ncbi:MAG: hypothetical protein ACREFM_10065, partial [Hypericibacter sp.]
MILFASLAQGWLRHGAFGMLQDDSFALRNPGSWRVPHPLFPTIELAMSIWGKILGGAAGFALGGPVGA